MGYLILGIIIFGSYSCFRRIYCFICYECCNVDGRFYEMGR